MKLIATLLLGLFCFTQSYSQVQNYTSVELDSLRKAYPLINWVERKSRKDTVKPMPRQIMYPMMKSLQVPEVTKQINIALTKRTIGVISSIIIGVVGIITIANQSQQKQQIYYSTYDPQNYPVVFALNFGGFILGLTANDNDKKAITIYNKTVQERFYQYER